MSKNTIEIEIQNNDIKILRGTNRKGAYDLICSTLSCKSRALQSENCDHNELTPLVFHKLPQPSQPCI